VRSETQTVHDRLREAILRHEVPADRPVSQVQLAKQLGVSRTPLREALRLLEQEGLVEARRNHQVRIAAVSPGDLEELYAMRITLEAFACVVTVPQLTVEDLGELDRALAAMDDCTRAGDFEAWHAPHRDFHQVLIRHAGTRLQRQVGNLFDHSQRYRRLYLAQPLSPLRGAEEHAGIRDACRDGDAVLAGDRLALHLSKTALTVIAMLDPERDPTKIRAALRFSRRGASA
jgi:DNA-binding GntR family transcriptional regulator